MRRNGWLQEDACRFRHWGKMPAHANRAPVIHLQASGSSLVSPISAYNQSPRLHRKLGLRLWSALPRSPRASLESGHPKRPTPSALCGSNPLGSSALRFRRTRSARTSTAACCCFSLMCETRQALTSSLVPFPGKRRISRTAEMRNK